jgi:hypothetical protein
VLIERGHIYIAQPPLYKVKRGKQEMYVKDDTELNAMLLNAALEDAELHLNSSAPPLAWRGARTLARRYGGAGHHQPLGAPLRRACCSSSCSTSPVAVAQRLRPAGRGCRRWPRELATRLDVPLADGNADLHAGRASRRPMRRA